MKMKTGSKELTVDSNRVNARLGPIQKKLVQWVTESGRVHIGVATVPPHHLGLGGYSMDEVGPSLARLVSRGILESDKPGFYCLPGWKPNPEWFG